MFPSNLEKEFEENSVTLHGRLSPWGPAYHTRSSLDPAQKKEEKTPYRARVLVLRSLEAGWATRFSS